jgi:phosphoglycolate phosphatase
MDQLYRRCFDDHLADDAGGTRYAQVQQAYDADYLANVAVRTRLYDGIAEALGALNQHGALACVTNKPARISRKLLDELGVGKLFSAVVGGDTCAQAKPHPMMLSAAAERCGFDPRNGRAFMIGDTAADMQLARAFGATSVWCAWGYVSALDASAPKPDFIARTPSDLVQIVVG